MPKSITIGDVPDETRDALAARAERVRSRASELDHELTVDEILELRHRGRR